MTQKIENPPRHVALIPDGNRRWSKIHRLGLLSAYDQGIKKFIKVAEWSKEFGVKTITVWALSTENLTNRTKTELRILFGLYTKAARDKSILKMLQDNQTRFRILGDLSVLPKKLRDALINLEHKTRMYNDMTVNMLINYGGQEDLLYAAKYLQKHAKNKASPEEVREHLRTAELPDVDLVVRTSGEMRLSGLLPWQTAYSELYFEKKFWPDFGKQDLKRALETFSRRQRRFGK